MALHHNHHLSFRGTSITKAPGMRCAVMSQVAISNWNKAAAAGFRL